jgi:hypothetical protein
LALASAWSISLLLMDIGTAKPTIVSPGQIRSSGLVVVARRVGADSDRIKLERVIRGDMAPDEEVRVVNLADVPDLFTNRSYLFALSRSRRDFEVTTLEGQRSAPLVYPAVPETIEQAKSILR